MALSTGSKVGPYEILSPAGAGGMGEIYRARDTRLDRTVAIKVLPAHFVSSADMKLRFEREARAISSLQHPHICVLFDVGRDDASGIEFLVMEYLEGETLGERLRKGPLPLDQVVKIGSEITEALDKAHRQGIIHRDLKPSNIMLTKSGAKLMDFGLAKPSAVGMSASSATAPLLSAAATASGPSPMTPLTTAGSIVGTIQYMSPEQIEGKEADARSDIFAFGAVLYEMATGQRAFAGKSQISVASAILEKDPEPISKIVPLTPAAFDRITQTCLAKDPEQRFQCAHDLNLELTWMGKGETPEATALPAKSAWFPWCIAAFFALALALVSYRYWATSSEQPLLRASILAPAGQHFSMSVGHGTPALSPDGKRLVFAASGPDDKTSIWIRDLDQADARQLPGSEGGYFPFWSPDGRFLAYFANGHLWKAGSNGEPPVSVADVQQARGGSWGADGSILFTPNITEPVMMISAEGGSIKPATQPQPGYGSQRWPQFLPDGKHFLYLSTISGTSDAEDQVRFASLDGKEDKILMKSPFAARYAGGHLLFVRDGVLMAQPFDAAKGILSGDATPVAKEVGVDAITANSLFSASEAGPLVYAPAAGSGNEKVVWFDHAGKPLDLVGQGQVLSSLRLSPNGHYLAADGVANASTSGVVWLYDLHRGMRSRFSFTGFYAFDPAWSPDGKTIYFISKPSPTESRLEILKKPTDGSTPEQSIWKSAETSVRIVDVTPDGQSLVIMESKQGKDSYELLSLTEKNAKPVTLFEGTQYNDGFIGALSPEGHWLAYCSTEAGQMQVFLTSFPQAGAKYQVSLDGGTQPIWARDGKTLYFLDPSRKLMAVRITGSGNALLLERPLELFPTNMRGSITSRGYDIAADGHFVIDTAGQEQNVPVNLIMNWTQALKR